MTLMPRQRRSLVAAAQRLVLAICVAAAMWGEVSGDTLRCELYPLRFSSGNVSQANTADRGLSAYLRVSSPDHPLGDIASQMDWSPVSGERGKVVFEFFVASRSRDVTVSRVRFHVPDRATRVLADLDDVWSVDRDGHISDWLLSPHDTSHCEHIDGPLRSARYVDSADDRCMTIELSSTTARRGVTAGEVIGLMFQLVPGETIDTLIDDHLARGDLRPEVEISVNGKGSFSASVVRRIDFTPRAPAPVDSVFTARACPVLYSAPVRSHATVNSWTALQPDLTTSPSFQDPARSLLTRVQRGVRVRAPPKSLAPV